MTYQNGGRGAPGPPGPQGPQGIPGVPGSNQASDIAVDASLGLTGPTVQTALDGLVSSSLNGSVVNGFGASALALPVVWT